MTARDVVRRGAGVSRRVARRALETRAGRRLRRPAISVIVPFYNVEQYLADCLDSILAQDFSDLEVLLVDDGSPDGSRAIAQAYVEQDARVRLVTRENGGLGAARNTGVRHARFGEGTVLSLSGSGSDAQAQIQFRDVGTKTLALGIARLEIIT